jgi:hypothetical protein
MGRRLMQVVEMAELRLHWCAPRIAGFAATAIEGTATFDAARQGVCSHRNRQLLIDAGRLNVPEWP